MRRRLRLRVLYWPTLSSAAIVALLLLYTGPSARHWDSLRGEQGDGGELGADGRCVSALVGPAKGLLMEIGQGMAARSGGRAAGRPPRTLVTHPSAIPAMLLGEETAPNRDRGPASRDEGPNRSVAARAALLPCAPLATAELRAPQRRIDEELAGLDRGELVDQAPSGLHLASYGRPEAPYQLAGQRSGQQAYIGDELRDASSGMAMVNRNRHGLGGGWPEAPQLIEDLRHVAVDAAGRSSGELLVGYSPDSPAGADFQAWQQEVSAELDHLRQFPSLASADSAAALARLATLARSGYEAAEAVEDRQAQINCLRAAHALQRRVAVWAAAHQATSAALSSGGDNDGHWAGRQQIDALIQQVAADVAASQDAEGWERYLLLDELSRANQRESESERRIVAQRFLSRLTWYGLSKTQQDWMQRESLDALGAAVRRWAIAPIDYASLLGQLERQESDAIDLGGIDVARATQSLRFATSPEATRLAATINTHYRNANIRLAVTDTLINRLIPEVDARIDPVRQRILGADVRGQSHVDSQLAVRLIPSASTWRLQLDTEGRVQADTVGRTGPVAIRTGSHANFVSSTPLEFTRLSAAAGDTRVSVDSSTRLHGVATDFDSVPLIGTLVREIALNRYHSLAPQAKRIQQGQIREGVGSEVDQRVTEQIHQASDAVTRHLLGPLGSLGLNPMVVDMQTTPQRLTARYRVGGDWQLAAFTPRPRAPAESLMSLQLHQSVFNNTLETVLPAGQTSTIHELSTHLKDLFAIPENATLGDNDDHDLTGDTLIQFASTRPVTIEIEDDILWVTLRVMRLSRQGAIDLRRFIVRAAYRCESDGLSASLVRDGHLRISGPGMSMRDRLPVRAIFNKVFSARRPLPLIPARMSEHAAMQGLVITQLELRDGWIGLAIGQETPPRVAKNDG